LNKEALEMPIAALPKYLGQDFRDASPGMRFGMYLLPVWIGPRHPKKKDPESEKRAWAGCSKLENSDIQRMKELSNRQNALAAAVGNIDRLTLDAQAVAPFTTGLGNEHPLENGFAFLWPYGLPYLPGSGVKGVLRQAARELAADVTDDGIAKWGGDSDWTAATIDALFGKEDSNDAQRGALTFWDVIPQIKGNKLMVEVMTGHQGHYYMEGQTPHESGRPNLINFLTVPLKSGFSFHVLCDRPFLRRIAPELAENDRWKALLQQAFNHAFDWLGFGAKTTVGYGAMGIDEAAAQVREKQARQQALEQLGPEEQMLAEVRKIFEDEQARGQLAAGSQTAQKRLKLLKHALAWEDAEHRKAAATLIRETLKPVPWSKRQKKMGIIEKLAKLETDG